MMPAAVTGHTLCCSFPCSLWPVTGLGRQPAVPSVNGAATLPRTAALEALPATAASLHDAEPALAATTTAATVPTSTALLPSGDPADAVSSHDLSLPAAGPLVLEAGALAAALADDAEAAIPLPTPLAALPATVLSTRSPSNAVSRHCHSSPFENYLLPAASPALLEQASHARLVGSLSTLTLRDPRAFLRHRGKMPFLACHLSLPVLSALSTAFSTSHAAVRAAALLPPPAHLALHALPEGLGPPAFLRGSFERGSTGLLPSPWHRIPLEDRYLPWHRFTPAMPS
jgi:hypothetical protein